MLLWGCFFSVIKMENGTDKKLNNEIVNNNVYSLNCKLKLNIFSDSTVCKPPIKTPLNIIASDHVEKLNDNDSILFFSLVFLKIKGNEQTFTSIIASPHPKKPTGINCLKSLLIDIMSTKLKNGTKKEDNIKKGLRFLDLIKIPNGRANIRTPKNLREL